MKKHRCCIVFLSLIVCLSACSDSEYVDPYEFISMHTQSMINGKPDTGVAHQAVVALYVTKNTIRNTICTGTLIHPQYVLTAAHCVTDTNETTGKIGKSSYNDYLKIGFGNNLNEVRNNLHDVEWIQWHDDYNMLAYSDTSGNVYPTIPNDIAIIKLKTAVPSNVARPIPSLPPKLAIPADANGNTSAYVTFSGYGYDEKGKLGTKLFFTEQLSLYCSPKEAPGCPLSKRFTVNGKNPGSGKSYDQTDNVMMPPRSLLYLQTDGGPCQGDSGGPAFYTVNGTEYLAAITSYGDSICGVYGISTATQDFYDWIIQRAPEVADMYDGPIDTPPPVDDPGTEPGSSAISDVTLEETAVEICGNDIDDNGDGLIDCADPACNLDQACSLANLIRNLTSQCSTMTHRPATLPWAFLLSLLALIGAAAVIRRAKT